MLLIAVILHVYIARHYTAKYELEKRRKQKMLGSTELELVEQEQKDVTNESTVSIARKKVPGGEKNSM